MKRVFITFLVLLLTFVIPGVWASSSSEVHIEEGIGTTGERISWTMSHDHPLEDRSELKRENSLCRACHEMKDINKEYEKSAHFKANVSCVSCHLPYGQLTWGWIKGKAGDPKRWIKFSVEGSEDWDAADWLKFKWMDANFGGVSQMWAQSFRYYDDDKGYRSWISDDGAGETFKNIGHNIQNWDRNLGNSIENLANDIKGFIISDMAPVASALDTVFKFVGRSGFEIEEYAGNGQFTDHKRLELAVATRHHFKMPKKNYCLNCHDLEKELKFLKSPVAISKHNTVIDFSKKSGQPQQACIECHQNIAHLEPDSVDSENKGSNGHR